MKPSFNNNCRTSTALKPLALAVALALPNAPSFAVSIKDVVTTRADRNMELHYGRDSVYAIAGARRLKPGQSLADSRRLFRKGKSYRAAAFDESQSLVTHQSAKSLDVFPANFRDLTVVRAATLVGKESPWRSSLPRQSRLRYLQIGM